HHPHPARPDPRAGGHEPPAGHPAADLAPGAGAAGRLLAGDGRAGAQEAAGRRPAARARQDHRAVRHPLTARAMADWARSGELPPADLRGATAIDADDVAALLTEMGYPCQTAEAAERIHAI